MTPVAAIRDVDARRLLDGALVLVVVGAVVFAVRWALDPDNLPLNTVEVRGELSHLEPAAVQEAVPIEGQPGFFGVPLGEVRDAVATLEWVRRVEVSRVWPDTVRLELVEREPVARVNGRALLGRDGELFRPGTALSDTALPEVKGPTGKAKALAELRRQFDERFREVGHRVAVIEGDERGAVRLTLDNEMEVVVGREARQDRVDRLIQAWGGLRRAGEGEPVRVDLRYPNGFAVRYAGSDDGSA